MSRPDLRALFRTNSHTLMSADVFANRHEEWAAVSRSLAAVVNARREPTFDVSHVARAVVYMANAGGATFPVPDRPAAAAEGAAPADAAPAVAAGK